MAKRRRFTFVDDAGAQFRAVYVGRLRGMVPTVQEAAFDAAYDGRVGLDFGVFLDVAFGSKRCVGNGQSEADPVVVGNGIVIPAQRVDEMAYRGTDDFGFIHAVVAVGLSGVWLFGPVVGRLVVVDLFPDRGELFRINVEPGGDGTVTQIRFEIKQPC